ncbi:AraC family transcriptional regulator [Mesorhizobium sp. STM 4661]|uniref:helix-turn-helix domain-containing protein n=1 Tax=Mesorhizobium sp. STM 4661 TaxID=1297570 RepID=UPI0002BE3236|nr:AraC family transcriptional regulator [Mesorhizobium sp. STM 4661]CCV12246.1 putative Transcriptional regulator, AraC family [Mesorhizobium sp. STM 4661]
MRIRSGLSYPIEFAPIHLEPSFPVLGGGPLHQHADHPINYLELHEELEIGYCHAGSGIFIVAGKVMPFMEGSISVINAAEPHCARSTPGTDSYWSWINLDPVRLLGPSTDAVLLDPSPLAGPNFINVLDGDRAKPVQPLVRRLISELTDHRPDYQSAVKALTWLIMIELKRLAPKDQPATIPHANFLRVAPALNYLASHHAEPLRVSKLAALCCLSEPHFRRLFAQAVGKSPQAYWLNLRLQSACSLLRSTTFSILDISQQAGFDTLSGFNRAFQKSFRMSPREWRRLN